MVLEILGNFLLYWQAELFPFKQGQIQKIESLGWGLIYDAAIHDHTGNQTRGFDSPPPEKFRH